MFRPGDVVHWQDSTPGFAPERGVVRIEGIRGPGLYDVWGLAGDYAGTRRIMGEGLFVTRGRDTSGGAPVAGWIPPLPRRKPEPIVVASTWTPPLPARKPQGGQTDRSVLDSGSVVPKAAAPFPEAAGGGFPWWVWGLLAAGIVVAARR
jgi:hypothetical protein